jgi:hypothetical protein
MTNPRDFFKRILNFVAKYPTRAKAIHTSLTTSVYSYELNAVSEDIDSLLGKTYKSLVANYRVIERDSKYFVLIKYDPTLVKRAKKALG